LLLYRPCTSFIDCVPPVVAATGTTNDIYVARVGWWPDGAIMAQVIAILDSADSADSIGPEG